jgi:hypothetical protein
MNTATADIRGTLDNAARSFVKATINTTDNMATAALNDKAAVPFVSAVGAPLSAV